jgi:hypothetical protein
MKPRRTPPSSVDRISIPGSPEVGGEVAEPQSYLFGPFRLIPGERILRRGDQALPLPPKAFDTCRWCAIPATS